MMNRGQTEGILTEGGNAVLHVLPLFKRTPEIERETI